jgi:N-acetyl-anhydromuramyl-L-alanine amidase AmpD
MPDEAGVTWIPNQNFFLDRNGLQPHYVILHGTAGGTSAVGIANYFVSTQDTANPVTSHYIIGTAGEVVQTVSEKDGAWGNGVLSTGHAAFWNESINPNNITISIEHCKPSLDNSDTLTAKQQAASFKLVYDICQRWQIPMHDADASGGITGHFSIDPINRSNCPGPYPWDALWAYLNSQGEEPVKINLNTAGVSNFFAAGANGHWLCKNTNMLIGGAILTFYQQFGNYGLCGVTYLGLPLSNEIAAKISGHPEVVYQRFERGVLAYDPSNVLDSPPGAGDVYCMHVDKGIGMFPVPAKAAVVSNVSEPVPATASATVAQSSKATGRN